MAVISQKIHSSISNGLKKFQPITIGLVFVLNINNLLFGQFTKIYDFTGIPDAQAPNKNELVFDGTFLIGTSLGGVTGDGVIFKIKPDGTGYSTIYDFATPLNGKRPGGLILDGTFLYGMTSLGGANDLGVIFKIKPDGTGYTKLLDFDKVNGSMPSGSLVSDGTYLYGMTNYGGAGSVCGLSSLGCGIIFKIKLDGTGYAKLHDFGSSSGKGFYPRGSLIINGTQLYGMTKEGGLNYGIPGVAGTIFKIQTDGTAFTNLIDFAGTSNGSNPYGSLITDGTYLYGLTTQGGTGATGCSYGCGVIFKVKLDGTGFVKLFDFSGVFGKQPEGSLYFDGQYLYGTTITGGIGAGVVFKIKPDGTNYYKLYDFVGSINGNQPTNTLISDGTFLYGTAYQGGANSKGTIFKLGIATSLSDFDKFDNINIYPNPNNGSFKIELEHNSFMATVTNILGECIYQSEIFIDSHEIQIPNQVNGIYFVHIKTDKGVITKKITIQKI
jgi:uncharacterized repeat protein (TIGR03803 family)